MYAYLRGVYKGSSPDAEGAVLLEVAGIGYELIVPPIVEQEIGATCQPDDPLLLYVSAQAGRDQPWPVLYGFLRPEERAFWELLKSIPRFGGKLAARAMALPVESIAHAIQQGNKSLLDDLPGVTADGADKMIASLRKKVSPFVRPVDRVERPRIRADLDGVRDDAVNALVQMGARRLDAQRGVDQLLAARDDLISVQDILTEYLRSYRGSGRAG
ncbi:MAG TPA: Holliday junction branch migration protein RuvA [Chloroflexota bacterium]|nr:Holliday junction branch migration protein RuvA [Chloroflexota bacterium]